MHKIVSILRKVLLPVEIQRKTSIDVEVLNLTALIAQFDMPVLQPGAVPKSAEVGIFATNVIDILMDKALAAIAPPDTIDFVPVFSGGATSVTLVTIGADHIYLTLNRHIQFGETGEVSYIQGTKKIQDLAGNVTVSFTINNVVVTAIAPPVIVSAEVGTDDGYTWHVVTDIALEATMPAASQFAVTGFTFASVTKVGSNEVELVSNELAVYGESYNLTYTKPASNPLQGLNNNYVITQSIAVTNNMPIPGPDGDCTNLQLTVVSDTQINLNWTNGFTNHASVSIERKLTSGGSWSEIFVTAADATTYNNTGLTQATDYSFRVRAVLNGNYSNYSNTANAVTLPSIPTGLTAVWVNDFARLTVNDIPVDVQIEWYESKNGGAYTLVTTTALDVVTTDNYTWQNESMAFKCRAKKGSNYSDYCAPVSLVTPLVWKRNESTLNTVSLTFVNITVGKTININWGDGTNNNYGGGYIGTITHTYTTQANPYYIQISGNVNYILAMTLASTLNNYGDVSKWILPERCSFVAAVNAFTGDVTNMVIPSECQSINMRLNLLTGKTPNIVAGTGTMYYQFQGNRLSSAGTNIFRKSMAVYDISAQNVSFPTAQIDALLAAILAWYTANAPTANCVYTMNGANMGSPTGGANNTYLLAVKAIYTAAGKTATFVIS